MNDNYSQASLQTRRSLITAQLRLVRAMPLPEYITLLTEGVSVSPDAFAKIRGIVIEDLEARLAEIEAVQRAA